MVCVCVCVCWSTIIRVVARGARGAHYLSIVWPVLKLPTPPYLVTPRDTISTLLACVFLFGAFVVCFLWFGALVVCFVCFVRDLSSWPAQEKERE